MIETVFYLVISDRDGSPGLIFPRETKNNDFRIGQWFIVVKGGRPKERYAFDVVQNGELITYYLVLIRNNIYQVTTKQGQTFFFRIEPRRFWSNRYVGRSKMIQPDDILLIVQPIDPDALTNAAEKKKFFFVGTVDNLKEQIG
jgi:hypothetical protein